MSTMALPAISMDTSLASYLNQISKLPYLTQEEEQDLAHKWVDEGDINAAHQLVTSHLRLVAKIASNFKGYGLPMLEMISEGNIGLMHAVRKFDPKKGFRLSTYAMWWIKASIQEYVLHSWSLVKIGTTAAQKKLFFNLKRMKNKLHKIDNSMLSPDDVATIASELDVSEKDVLEMDSRIAYTDQSLNAPMIGHEENSGELIDYLENEGDNQEVIVANMQDLDFKRSLFAKAMASLNDREQDIINERRLKEPVSTLENLSHKYNISRERVRQIEARAFEKLQNLVAEQTGQF